MRLSLSFIFCSSALEALSLDLRIHLSPRSSHGSASSSAVATSPASPLSGRQDCSSQVQPPQQFSKCALCTDCCDQALRDLNEDQLTERKHGSYFHLSKPHFPCAAPIAHTMPVVDLNLQLVLRVTSQHSEINFPSLSLRTQSHLCCVTSAGHSCTSCATLFLNDTTLCFPSRRFTNCSRPSIALADTKLGPDSSFRSNLSLFNSASDNSTRAPRPALAVPQDALLINSHTTHQHWRGILLGIGSLSLIIHLNSCSALYTLFAISFAMNLVAHRTTSANATLRNVLLALPDARLQH